MVEQGPKLGRVPVHALPNTTSQAHSPRYQQNHLKADIQPRAHAANIRSTASCLTPQQASQQPLYSLQSTIPALGASIDTHQSPAPRAASHHLQCCPGPCWPAWCAGPHSLPVTCQLQHIHTRTRPPHMTYDVCGMVVTRRMHLGWFLSNDHPSMIASDAPVRAATGWPDPDPDQAVAILTSFPRCWPCALSDDAEIGQCTQACNKHACAGKYTLRHACTTRKLPKAGALKSQNTASCNPPSHLLPVGACCMCSHVFERLKLSLDLHLLVVQQRQLTRERL